MEVAVKLGAGMAGEDEKAKAEKIAAAKKRVNDIWPPLALPGRTDEPVRWNN